MSDPTKSQVLAEPPATLLDNPWVAMGIEYGLMAGVFALTLLGGWVISGFLGRATARLIDRLGLEVLAEKLGAARLLYKIGVRGGVAKLGGKLARGVGLLLTVYVALAQLEIAALTHAMTAAIGFLPTVVTAAAIAVGGVWLSDKLKKMIQGEGEPGSTRNFVAQLAGLATLFMAVTMALEELGVQMELLHDILLGVYGVVVCSLGVMFALGARESMHQLIAGHYGRKLLKIGDLIHLPDQVDAYKITAFGPMHITATRDAHHDALVPYTQILTQSVHVTYSASEPADKPQAMSEA
jgi:hypothetical protein